MTQTRRLYLHEYVDIVGEGALEYMEHTVDFDCEGAADRGLSLFGTFQTVGSTGRWPQVVNLWEVLDGWEGWRRLMESTNLARSRNAGLKGWWRTALNFRSGGYDRLLGDVPGSPTLSELTAAGVRGSVFVHEVSRVRPGSARDYLCAVRDEWQPVMADHGHTLAGLYEALLDDTEVITLWSTDPAGHVELMAAAEGSDGRIAAWRERAREFITRWHEELLTPHPRTALSAGDPL